uniref:Protein kinase domain-containing protein n=1 Tax=Trypanosoma congolense (strain IL3000) TaxID=1068625 RepID=G0UQ15_TRYCI|nr:putative protein kinase [Trypanosoma congolense IL3000]
MSEVQKTSSKAAKVSFERRVIRSSARARRGSFSSSNAEVPNTSVVLQTQKNCVSPHLNTSGRSLGPCLLQVLTSDPSTIQESVTPLLCSKNGSGFTARIPARKVPSTLSSPGIVPPSGFEEGNLVVDIGEGVMPISPCQMPSAAAPQPLRIKPYVPRLVSGDLVPLTPVGQLALFGSSGACTPSSTKEGRRQVLIECDGRSSSDDSRRRGLHSASIFSPTPSALPYSAMGERPMRVCLAHKALIGKGSFGVVFQAMNLDTNQIIAVKEIAFASDTSDEVRKAVRREFNTLRVLDHPHVVKCLGAEWSDTYLRIYLEYVSGGSISSILRTFGPFREKQASIFTRQMLHGLAYLHSRNIIHRDIKGDNLLVDTNGTLKISDFGTAKCLLGQQQHRNTSTSVPAGTVYFMAPEVIIGDPEGFTSDIWSVGCCVIEMLTGSAPFSRMKNQYSAMMRLAEHKGELASSMIPKDRNLSDKTVAFLMRCLQRDQSKRPSAMELLMDPWIQSPPEDSEPSTSGDGLLSVSIVQRDQSNSESVVVSPLTGFNCMSRTPKFGPVTNGTSETASLTESKVLSTMKSSTKSNKALGDSREERLQCEGRVYSGSSGCKEPGNDGGQDEKGSAGGVGFSLLPKI